MLDRLAAAYDRERRFVADASHELRTPLAVLKTELEVALRARPADRGCARRAAVARSRRADRLAQLAEDLLVLARAGDGALPVRPRAAARATALLDGVRRRFSVRAAERGGRSASTRRTSLELRRRRAAARAGARQPRRQRAPPRRRATMRLRGRPDAGAVELDGRRRRARASRRSCAGAPSSASARGDAARSRGGAGLGLAIVRAIAEAHGGGAELAAAAAVRISLPSQGDPSSRPYVAPMPTQGGTT